MSLNKTQDISRFEDLSFALGQELLLRPELVLELELELKLELEKELEPELKLELELDMELLLESDCHALEVCQKNNVTNTVSRLQTCILQMYFSFPLLVVLRLLLKSK